MALDEAIATRVRLGAAPPTLRLYGWERPAVTIGCFQKSTEIDLDFCRNRGIAVVRRPTGGRAILHGTELTYSFSARTDYPGFSNGLSESYRAISTAFSLAFRTVGVAAEMKAEHEKGRVLGRSPLCFASSSYAELLVRGRKVVGSAQKRWPDGLLQQGAIPYRIDRALLSQVFGADCSGSTSVLAALEEVVPGFDRSAFQDAVVSAFEETFGVMLMEESPGPEEEELGRLLLKSRYLQDDWNLRHLGRRAASAS